MMPGSIWQKTQRGKGPQEAQAKVAEAILHPSSPRKRSKRLAEQRQRHRCRTRMPSTAFWWHHSTILGGSSSFPTLHAANLNFSGRRPTRLSPFRSNIHSSTTTASVANKLLGCNRFRQFYHHRVRALCDGHKDACFLPRSSTTTWPAQYVTSFRVLGTTAWHFPPPTQTA